MFWKIEWERSRESEEKLLLNRAILKGIHQVRLFCVLLKGLCDYPSLSWADQEILKGYRDGVRVLLESSCFGCISRYFRVSISFLNWSRKEEIVFLSEELPFDRDVLGIKNTDFKSIASKTKLKNHLRCVKLLHHTTYFWSPYFRYPIHPYQRQLLRKKVGVAPFLMNSRMALTP